MHFCLQLLADLDSSTCGDCSKVESCGMLSGRAGHRPNLGGEREPSAMGALAETCLQMSTVTRTVQAQPRISQRRVGSTVRGVRVVGDKLLREGALGHSHLQVGKSCLGDHVDL